MRYLPPDESNVKPVDRSAGLTKALKDKSSTIAVQTASSAIGRNHPAMGDDEVVDRPPGVIAILRAAGWLGSNR